MGDTDIITVNLLNRMFCILLENEMIKKKTINELERITKDTKEGRRNTQRNLNLQYKLLPTQQYVHLLYIIYCYNINIY